MWCLSAVSMALVMVRFAMCTLVGGSVEEKVVSSSVVNEFQSALL